jgi:hypothetical protein
MCRNGYYKIFKQNVFCFLQAMQRRVTWLGTCVSPTTTVSRDTFTSKIKSAIFSSVPFFWHMTLCPCGSDLDVSLRLLSDVASYPIRTESSAALLRRAENLHHKYNFNRNLVWGYSKELNKVSSYNSKPDNKCFHSKRSRTGSNPRNLFP